VPAKIDEVWRKNNNFELERCVIENEKEKYVAYCNTKIEKAGIRQIKITIFNIKRKESTEDLNDVKDIGKVFNGLKHTAEYLKYKSNCK